MDVTDVERRLPVGQKWQTEGGDCLQQNLVLGRRPVGGLEVAKTLAPLKLIRAGL